MPTRALNSWIKLTLPGYLRGNVTPTRALNSWIKLTLPGYLRGNVTRAGEADVEFIVQSRGFFTTVILSPDGYSFE